MGTWVILAIATIFTIAAISICIVGHKISDGFWPVWAIIAAWSFTIMALIAGGVYAGTIADKISCRNTAINANTDYRWSLSTGCMFKFQDRFIPKDRWINITNEGF